MEMVLLSDSYFCLCFSSPQIEKKNNAPKYLRGVRLEEACDNKGQPFSYCSFTKVWATGICKVVYASSSGSSIYSSGYCEGGDLYCCK